VRALTGQPAYRQVADDLRRKIADGTLAVGTRLPTTTELMSSYEVSSTVVKAAINQLKIEGLVIGQQGKGVFVRQPPRTGTGSESTEFAEIMGHLQTMRADLEQLNERLARVEEVVADGRSSQRQPPRRVDRPSPRPPQP
jgi:GntR family transcriptional regulator